MSTSDPKRTLVSPKSRKRHVMERRLGLLRLDARKLDHLRPLLHLGRDEGLTFSRGQRHRHDTEVRKPRLQCRLGQSSNHFLIERGDDLGGQMLWCAKSLPSAGLESRNELAQGWHVRQRVCARHSRNRQSAQCSSLDVPEARLDRLECDLNMTGDKIDQFGC